MAGLLMKRNDTLREITIPRIPLFSARMAIDQTDIPGSPAYKLMGRGIGYINPGRLKVSDIDSIRQLFKSTRGIIVDLRCYPAIFMPFTYGSWLKTGNSPFALFTRISLRRPGAFVFGSPVSNGGSGNSVLDFPYPVYTGKLIIIVNSITQSQAEYTAMALRSVPNALVIGSKTAGADGNVSMFSLPGGIQTMFSGLGVYYPDMTETQRVGIRIDVPVQSTIKGIKEGRDEYLDAAVNLIK